MIEQHRGKTTQQLRQMKIEATQIPGKVLDPRISKRAREFTKDMTPEEYRRYKLGITPLPPAPPVPGVPIVEPVVEPTIEPVVAPPVAPTPTWKVIQEIQQVPVRAPPTVVPTITPPPPRWKEITRPPVTPPTVAPPPTRPPIPEITFPIVTGPPVFPTITPAEAEAGVEPPSGWRGEKLDWWDPRQAQFGRPDLSSRYNELISARPAGVSAERWRSEVQTLGRIKSVADIGKAILWTDHRKLFEHSGGEKSEDRLSETLDTMKTEIDTLIGQTNLHQSLEKETPASLTAAEEALKVAEAGKLEPGVAGSIENRRYFEWYNGVYKPAWDAYVREFQSHHKMGLESYKVYYDRAEAAGIWDKLEKLGKEHARTLNAYNILRGPFKAEAGEIVGTGTPNDPYRYTTAYMRRISTGLTLSGLPKRSEYQKLQDRMNKHAHGTRQRAALQRQLDSMRPGVDQELIELRGQYQRELVREKERAVHEATLAGISELPKKIEIPILHEIGGFFDWLARGGRAEAPLLFPSMEPVIEPQKLALTGYAFAGLSAEIIASPFEMLGLSRPRERFTPFTMETYPGIRAFDPITRAHAGVAATIGALPVAYFTGQMWGMGLGAVGRGVWEATKVPLRAGIGVSRYGGGVVSQAIRGPLGRVAARIPRYPAAAIKAAKVHPLWRAAAYQARAPEIKTALMALRAGKATLRQKYLLKYGPYGALGVMESARVTEMAMRGESIQNILGRMSTDVAMYWAGLPKGLAKGWRAVPSIGEPFAGLRETGLADVRKIIMGETPYASVEARIALQLTGAAPTRAARILRRAAPFRWQFPQVEISEAMSSLTKATRTTGAGYVDKLIKDTMSYKPTGVKLPEPLWAQQQKILETLTGQVPALEYAKLFPRQMQMGRLVGVREVALGKGVVSRTELMREMIGNIPELAYTKTSWFQPIHKIMPLKQVGKFMKRRITLLTVDDLRTAAVRAAGPYQGGGGRMVWGYRLEPQVASAVQKLNRLGIITEQSGFSPLESGTMQYITVMNRPTSFIRTILKRHPAITLTKPFTKISSAQYVLKVRGRGRTLQQVKKIFDDFADDVVREVKIKEAIRREWVPPPLTDVGPPRMVSIYRRPAPEIFDIMLGKKVARRLIPGRVVVAPRPIITDTLRRPLVAAERATTIVEKFQSDARRIISQTKGVPMQVHARAALSRRIAGAYVIGPYGEISTLPTQLRRLRLITKPGPETARAIAKIVQGRKNLERAVADIMGGRGTKTKSMKAWAKSYNEMMKFYKVKASPLHTLQAEQYALEAARVKSIRVRPVVGELVPPAELARVPTAIAEASRLAMGATAAEALRLRQRQLQQLRLRQQLKAAEEARLREKAVPIGVLVPITAHMPAMALQVRTAVKSAVKTTVKQAYKPISILDILPIEPIRGPPPRAPIIFPPIIEGPVRRKLTKEERERIAEEVRRRREWQIGIPEMFKGLF